RTGLTMADGTPDKTPDQDRAAAGLLAEGYAELRRLAAGLMSRLAPGQALQRLSPACGGGRPVAAVALPAAQERPHDRPELADLPEVRRPLPQGPREVIAGRGAFGPQPLSPHRGEGLRCVEDAADSALLLAWTAFVPQGGEVDPVDGVVDG